MKGEIEKTSLRANGRASAPDGTLREAIHNAELF
jgi:hypothetical protein